MPTALPYPEHLGLATLGSRHNLHQTTGTLHGAHKNNYHKKEKNIFNSTGRSSEAIGHTMPWFHPMRRPLQPAAGGERDCSGGGGPMPDLHPIRSDDPQSATARNPVIHPKAGRRIGSFPDSGYRGSTRSRRRSLQPVTGEKNRTSIRHENDAIGIATLMTSFSRSSEHTENTHETNQLKPGKTALFVFDENGCLCNSVKLATPQLHIGAKG